jgi:hypothetical protein
MGAANVPSYYRIEKLQKTFKTNFLGSMIKETSSLGNIYYMHDLSAIVARVRPGVWFIYVFLTVMWQDFSSPTVREFLGPKCGVSVMVSDRLQSTCLTFRPPRITALR